MRKSPFLLFPGIVPCSIFVAQRFECNLLRRLLRLLPFCGTIVFDNAYPYLWFVRRPFGTAGVAQRAGLSMRNIVGVFWRMILFPTDSDGGGCLRPLRGCGKGGAVEFLGEMPFVRTERRGIGGFRHRRLCSVPCPVPCGSSMFCSEKREESSRLSVRGAAAHVCLSVQGSSPLRNAGRIRPATSETMDYPV